MLKPQHGCPCLPNTIDLFSNTRFSNSTVVLDTNVVLDMLVFRNTVTVHLLNWLNQGQIHWLASPQMRDELAHVLARGRLTAWHPNLVEIWSAWNFHCQSIEPIPLSGPALRLQCSDPDDQKFIDFALGHKTRWLLSKDRAVLKLASRAREFGVEILTPAAWVSNQITN